MYFPYEVEAFFEQYGPLILDILLALPLVRLIRVLLTRFRNRTIAKQNRPSLLQLPDEIILEVLSVVHSQGCPPSRRNRRTCHGCSRSRQELVNVSMTNKRMRNICAPFIFTHVKIGRLDYGWWRASRSLKAAEMSFHAKQYARSLIVSVYPAGYKKITYPSKSFSRRLALVLPGYDHVRQLYLIVPAYTATGFKKVFEKGNLELPNVQTLILGSHVEWIINMCPKVEVISTVGVHWLGANIDGTWPQRQPYDLIRAAGRAPNLRHFEMHESWGIDLVETVLKCMPDIESLAMPGRQYIDRAHVLLFVLCKLRNLKSLALSDPSNLRVGFDPPTCGNAYMGPGGDAMKLQVRQQRLEAVSYVGKMVLEKMGSLNELWIGLSNKATFSTNANGCREIIWTDEFRRIPGEID